MIKQSEWMTNIPYYKFIEHKHLISKKIYLAIAYFLLFNISYSQKPVSIDHASNDYFNALELFTNQKYNAASNLFQSGIIKNPNSAFYIDSKYYIALCSYELFHPDAKAQFEYIYTHFKNHPRGNQSAFYIAKVLFRDKKYKDISEKLENIDISILDHNEESDYWFMKGYSYYKLNQYDESKAAFANIVLDSNKYYYDANYYKGYIHYLKEEYDLAEQCFKRVISHAYYGQVAPMYIAQIYMKQDKYKEALELTDTITRAEILYDALHISAICAYHIKDFSKSVDKYQRYYKANKPMNDSDWYMSAKSNLKTNSLPNSIYNFNKIKPSKDSFYQVVLYDLAYAYLQSGLKENSRSAFNMAYNLPKDSILTEEAGYYFNLLSVELYHENVKTIESILDYIQKYPETAHSEELKDMLSGLLLNSKQFQKTIDILSKIPNKTERVKIVLQKSAYCRGEELYALNNYPLAIEYFNLSLTYPIDNRFRALAGYWLAEIAYKENQYENAIKLYSDFIKTEEASKSVHYSTCFYNIGWCYLKLNNYNRAASTFKEFNELADYLKKDQNMLIDGHIRLADCRFMLRNYQDALNEYNWVISKDNLYHDYALFQKGILYGLLNKPYEKINTLTKIVDVYEESDYLEKAIYELGYTNFYLDKLDEAHDWFDQLINKKKGINDIRRAHLNIGLIFKRQNKNAKAIEEFKYIVTKYTQSEEAKEALIFLKQLYIENGEITQYNDFVKTVPGLSSEISDNEADIYESLTFAIKKSDTTSALLALNTYISQYPEGTNILNAHVQRGDIYYKLKKYTESLVDYEWIASISSNEYSERAVKNCATINYSNKNYSQAFPYFQKLETLASSPDHMLISLNGQMRCAQKLKNTSDIKASCEKLLARKDIPKDILAEARFELAKIIYTEDKKAAFAMYKEILKGAKNIKAAEAKYMIAQIQYDWSDTLACKKTIKELNRDFSDFEFWVAKGFILLADNYILMKDTFQAKATLTSILENFETDPDDPEDLRKIAQDKLNLLQVKEQFITPTKTEEIETQDE